MAAITLSSAAVGASPLLFPQIPHMLIPSWMHISIATCLAWIAAHSVRLHGGRRTAAFFAAAIIVPTALEMTGVKWGFPSGLYHYAAPWRPVIAGVPLFVMMSWPVMIYAAWCAAALVVRSDERAGTRRAKAVGTLCTAGLASGVLVAQDIAIEMLAVRLGWWQWLGYEGTNALYALTGATPRNFVMWFGIGLCVIAAAELAPAAPRPEGAGRLRLAGLVFFCAVGINLALPVIAIVGDAPGVLMLALTGGIALLALARHRRQHMWDALQGLSPREEPALAE